MTPQIPFAHPNEVETRFIELADAFYNFARSYEKKHPELKVELDHSKLYLAVTAYYHDVARYKWWHYRNEAGGPEQSSLFPAKHAAFFCYWINRIGPLYVVRKNKSAPAKISDGGMPVDLSVAINVQFSIFIAILLLDFTFTPHLIAKLIYQLLWREGSARSYIMLFETLQDVRDGVALVLSKKPSELATRA